MPYFRKKPVVIEARLLAPDTFGEIMAWCDGTHWSKPPMRAVTGITIPTLEGEHHASMGDYVIKGIAGEFYACKPDIFTQTYEPC